MDSYRGQISTQQFRNRAACIYAITEEDDQGETWIDCVMHDRRQAEMRAQELIAGAENGTVNAFVTELQWTHTKNRFVVVTPK